MTISRDLMLSILSMDAYNRGYNEGITGLGTSNVGNASVEAMSTSEPGSAEVNASFFAISYTIGGGVTGIAPGTTVISYRGTDEFAAELFPVDLPISFGGSYQQAQIIFAQQFFRMVDSANGGAPFFLLAIPLVGRWLA